MNHCLDVLRNRQTRMGQQTDSLDEPDATPVASPVPVLGAVSRIDLERAIESLPPACRAAFLLHDVEGFGHQEVGAMLGISEGTSKSQVHKARMRIRSYLAHGASESDGLQADDDLIMNCDEISTKPSSTCVDGRLDGAGQRAVERHLEGCQDCRALVEDLRINPRGRVHARPPASRRPDTVEAPARRSPQRAGASWPPARPGRAARRRMAVCGWRPPRR